ncbi:hypothetical protein DH2020_008447 [Rehmannia glutinosa]|uniref:Endoplasmic reticulum vesicle transporter C-terminal domain-containing protein n=1 Tax=Rehmannia glutinosa TaxID=99300 RepID=A0ABR0U123_REHGL
MGNLKQALRSLDAFPRAEEHLMQKTKSGAFVFMLSFYYRTVNHGDPVLARVVLLSFNIYCTPVLSVDAIDMSGKHEVDLDTNIWKLRLNKDGHIIGTEYLSDLVEKEHAAHEHGSLKDDLKDHHEESDHKIKLQSLDEEAENMIKKVKHALANGEGCRVYGVLDVQRVAGNFHISVHGLNIFVAQMGFLASPLYSWGCQSDMLGLQLNMLNKPYKYNGAVSLDNVVLVLRYSHFWGSSHVNVSHIIHDLSFGSKYPGIHNPLDDTVRILRGTSGTFKYYIKIVPTEYKYISKEILATNQFSVTEYFSPINEFDRTWPAVYFLYDLSPITVTIREERRSFLHFITRLCAVLGGTFALTGMLDRWMYRLIESLTKPNARSIVR